MVIFNGELLNNQRVSGMLLSGVQHAGLEIQEITTYGCPKKKLLLSLNT
jgi:hypothetical protein